MTLKIAFSSEIESKLREAATSEGKDVEGFVRHLVEERLANAAEAQSAKIPPRTRNQLLLEKFDAWVNSHPVRENIHLDADPAASRPRPQGKKAEVCDDVAEKFRRQGFNV